MKNFTTTIAFIAATFFCASCSLFGEDEETGLKEQNGKITPGHVAIDESGVTGTPPSLDWSATLPQNFSTGSGYHYAALPLEDGGALAATPENGLTLYLISNEGEITKSQTFSSSVIGEPSGITWYFPKARTIYEKDNGNFVIAGTYGAMVEKILFILEVDPALNLVSLKNSEQFNCSQDYGITWLDDGGVLFSSQLHEESRAVIIRYDDSLTEVWRKYHFVDHPTTEYSSNITSIAIANDGNLYYTGPASYSYMSEGLRYSVGNLFFGKAGSDGKTQWNKALEVFGNDFLYDVTIATDGNLVATGYVSNEDGWARKTFVAKFKPDGTIIWANTYSAHSGDDTSFSIGATPDGGTVILIQGQSYTSNNECLLMKLNASGNIEWSKPVEGSVNGFGFANALQDGYFKNYIYDDGGNLIIGKSAAGGLVVSRYK